MGTEGWELATIVALAMLGVILAIVVLACFYLAVRAVALWFASGQWRKDLWR